MSDAADDLTTGVLVKNKCTDEKREQRNARRRATYRKKKEEAIVKQQDENQPSLTMPGMII